MPDTDLRPALVASYDPEVRPLKSGGRADWTVNRQVGSAVQAPDFVDTMRRFFAEMDDEITARSDDPVALTQGLARIEALLADVRYVRDRMRDTAAEGMRDASIRKLTVEGVTTVEQINDSSGRQWDHHSAMTAFIETRWPTLIDADSGEVLPAHEIATHVLAACAPAYWRLTPLRESGINPDDHSEQPCDEDGKPIKRPTIRIHDNRIRSGR